MKNLALKAYWAIPIIASILILGTVGVQQVFAPDNDKPEKIVIIGNIWNAETQSFEIEFKIHHGIAQAGQNADFSILAELSIDIGQTSPFLIQHIFDIEPDFDGQKVLVIPWDRKLADGSEFTGLADVLVDAKILNPGGRIIGTTQAVFVDIDITPARTGGVLSATAVDAITGLEIENYHVDIFDEDGVLVFSTVAFGNVNVVLPPGRYEATFSHDDYLPEDVSFDITAGAVTNVVAELQPISTTEPNQKTKTIKISKFKLDVSGDQISTPNGKWYDISGEDLTIDVREVTSGKDDQGQSRPGQMYFTDITLKGPFVSDRDPLDEWIKDLNESKPSQNTNDKNNPINIESEKLTVELNCALIESLGQRFVNQQTQTGDTDFDFVDLPPVPDQTSALVIHELVLSNVAIARDNLEIDPLRGWIDDTSEGQNIRKNISVIIQKKDGSEAKRFNLVDCFPTSFSFPELSASGTGNLYEEITFKPERLGLE